MPITTTNKVELTDTFDHWRETTNAIYDHVDQNVVDLDVLSDSIRWNVLDNPKVKLFDKSNLVESLNGPLTWFRSQANSVTTYIDETGVLQYAEADQPRLEKEGWLFEGPSKNLWKTPIEDVHATSSGLIEETETIKGPDNKEHKTKKLILTASGNNLHRMTWRWEDTTGSATGGDQHLTNPRNSSAPEDITTSFFIKASRVDFWDDYFLLVQDFTGLNPVRSGRKYIDIKTKSLMPGFPVEDNRFKDQHKIEELANGWYRVSISYDLFGSGTRNPAEFDPSKPKSLLLDIGKKSIPAAQWSGEPEQAGDTLWLWGSQHENLHFPSSYIPVDPATNSGSFRSGDIGKIQSGGNVPEFLLGEEMTLICEYTPKDYMKNLGKTPEIRAIFDIDCQHYSRLGTGALDNIGIRPILSYAYKSYMGTPDAVERYYDRVNSPFTGIDGAVGYAARNTLNDSVANQRLDDYSAKRTVIFIFEKIIDPLDNKEKLGVSYKCAETNGTWAGYRADPNLEGNTFDADVYKENGVLWKEGLYNWNESSVLFGGQGHDTSGKKEFNVVYAGYGWLNNFSVYDTVLTDQELNLVLEKNGE